MAIKVRRRACNQVDARTRLRQAEAFLTTAQMVTSEQGKPADYDYDHVAAGIAVLAAIAASDALCCRLLGERARGQDHRQAIGLLEQIRYGQGSPAEQHQRARQLGRALAIALDIKDESHYGVTMLAQGQARRVMRAADTLVRAAHEVVRERRG